MNKKKRMKQKKNDVKEMICENDEISIEYKRSRRISET